MHEILEALDIAFQLIFSMDREVLEVTARSLYVSLCATVIASFIGMLLGAALAVCQFRGKPVIIALLNALIGIPPVVVGLVLYLLLSRAGPFGVLGLLYTPSAMIIAQSIIILPLISSIIYQSLKQLWSEYRDLLISLHARPWQSGITLLMDGRDALLTASLAGFGRAIGEVGAVMIVGGNIDHLTRVLTTAITLETSKGNLSLALALGIILITISIGVSLALHAFSALERVIK